MVKLPVFSSILFYDDLMDHQLARFENVLKELLWRASNSSAGIPPDNLSADAFCTTLLTDALNRVTHLCNTATSPTIFANLNEYLSKKTESDRYSPFVDAINDVLEKLEILNIPELKRAPQALERIIFLVNHPNEIPIQSGEVASYRKPDVVIMRLRDAAQACSYPLRMKSWGQLKKIAPFGVKPHSFHEILSCVEFKATRTGLQMPDCPKDDRMLLDVIDPMHLIGDGSALRAAKKAAEKEGQVESHALLGTGPGSGSRKRALETDDAGNDGGPHLRSAKRVSVESGPSRSRYPRAAKVPQMAPGAAHPRQATGSGPQTRTPQERTSKSKTRDPILQLGSYAMEMFSLSRVHVWNILIIDERVYIWFHDRQGGIRSYGLDIIKNLSHFFVLLLALQRLDQKGWGFAPTLSIDTPDDLTAQLDVTLPKPAGNSEALDQQPTATIKFRHDSVLRAPWGLVGRATAVYECDLIDHSTMARVVKLSWPEASNTPEPQVLKTLGEIPDAGVKGHIPALLASEMPATMDTSLIGKRLGSCSQPHFPEPRAPRRLVITVCPRYSTVWDLSPDGFFEVWIQSLLCHVILWGKDFHHRDVSPGNMMYYSDENSVVGVLGDWDLATVISSSDTPNTDRTGTIPFMALQLLEGKPMVRMFRHDAESFIWLFLWVCGCSDGSKREVVVAPYKVWRKLDLLACKVTRGAFLSAVNLERINVSEHHARNALFCLFLADLLQQLRRYIWNDIPTSADRNLKEQRDMVLFEALLPMFREVRAALNNRFYQNLKDWYDERIRFDIDAYIENAVRSIIQSILNSRPPHAIIQLNLVP